MKHKFIINKSCTRDTVNYCIEDNMEKIKSKMGVNESGINYHVSIFHDRINNNHRYWVFLYDRDHRHESDHKNETVFTDNIKVRKFIGTKPTLKELKKVLE